MIANAGLLRKGYTLVNLKGSDEEKLSYYTALETSHIEKKPEAFQTLIAKAETDSLKKYLSIMGETV